MDKWHGFVRTILKTLGTILRGLPTHAAIDVIGSVGLRVYPTLQSVHALPAVLWAQLSQTVMSMEPL